MEKEGERERDSVRDREEDNDNYNGCLLRIFLFKVNFNNKKSMIFFIWFFFLIWIEWAVEELNERFAF